MMTFPYQRVSTYAKLPHKGSKKARHPLRVLEMVDGDERYWLVQEYLSRLHQPLIPPYALTMDVCVLTSFKQRFKK